MPDEGLRELFNKTRGWQVFQKEALPFSFQGKSFGKMTGKFRGKGVLKFRSFIAKRAYVAKAKKALELWFLSFLKGMRSWGGTTFGRRWWHRFPALSQSECE